MATAEAITSSSLRREPGSFCISAACYPQKTLTSDVDAEEVVSKWVDSFVGALNSTDYSKLSKLFLKESYWRDQLSLSWDFYTLKGPEHIISFLKNNNNGGRLKKISIDSSSALRSPKVAPFDFGGTIKGVQSFLTIETDIGRGRGLVRLIQCPVDGTWKSYTLLTTMHELKGYEELVGGRRPMGVNHGGQPDRMNWQERRESLQNFKDGQEPTVLVVGAGQGGLTIAARLKMLGVESLIIDRNERVGDNWRNRYHHLVLHDPVWYDHMPYLSFPPNWPVFTPKDKLGDWFESYASALELNVWMKTTIKSSVWEDGKRQWTVVLGRVRDGKTETRTVHPRHVIQATGHSGEPYFPSHIQGIESFKGDLLTHSSKFTGAKKDDKGKGKHAVVVGCCNSGHDIAQDYYESGYESVTMVQRSSNYVISRSGVTDVLLAGLYVEGGPPTEDADLINYSIPNHVVKRMHQDATAEIARRDKPLLDGLTKAGFKLNYGPDDSGLFNMYFQRGGGYYIDVGASQLIADGKIKIKQGQEIASVNAHSLSFADGTQLPADEIVFATGYKNMRETARTIFGEDVYRRTKDIWGYDEEGELRTIWRRSGHPGFWFVGGAFALCRYYSRLLALQILALEKGLAKWEDQ